MCIFVYSNPKPESSLFKIVQFSKKKTPYDSRQDIPPPLSFIICQCLNAINPMLAFVVFCSSAQLQSSRISNQYIKSFSVFPDSINVFQMAKQLLSKGIKDIFPFRATFSVSSINLLSAVKYLFS